MIKKLVLDHKGGYYSYRLHNLKANKLCNDFSSLKNYLNEMFENCPNDYFNSDSRSSKLKFKLNNLKLHRISGHEISDLAKHALNFNRDRFRDNHPKIQVFLLENDDKTIAMEIPIWLNPQEINDMNNIFKAKSPLTGHIDLLRIEDGKIWIWDYKPSAFDEKYASTQIFFYALMLSKRTNINLEEFRCGYFDTNYAYVFKPELNMINNKSILEFI